MEKNSAACAMGWSIELEKGLRSKRPGHPIESIHRMGPRLKQWSMEHHLTTPVYFMLGLVPGEDRLFADAILLRLGDAFVSGDRTTRIAIIKVFLSILRYCKTKNAAEHGIFSTMSMEIRLELMRRVKALLNVECIESRALAFVLFGCWAGITKDFAEIRHGVLSSLVSCHLMEVKASLFAAGCFSEVSDDFGIVFLKRLLYIMTSPKTSLVLKIAGARAFSKINCSVLLAIKSYKVGAELVGEFSEEDILAAMLISLTKLSSKAAILISEQVALLSSFLERKSSLHMQGTVLRCMAYLAERAACLIPINASVLFRIFDDPTLPSPLRCDVLRIFLKIIPYCLPDILLTDANEFMRLLRHVEDAARSSFLSERILAFRTLIHISYKLKGKLEIMFEGNANTFLSRVVLSVCDQITQLITQVSVGSGNSEIEQEFRSMLKFLLVLVESHSELDYFILDKLYSMIENTVSSHNTPLQNSAVHKAVKARVEETSFSLRIFMFHIHRFLVVFLENLDEVGASNNQVVLKIKDLVSFVCGSSLFDCSIHSFYGLLLHSPVIWGSLLYEDKKISDFVQNTGETSIHECVGNILAGRDNWCAYRAGKFAACEGVWYVANMIFQRLETRVQSQFCCQWLKLLVNFTHIEKNAQMLLQKVCQPRPQHNDDMEVILSGDLEKFHEICDDIFSSDKVLEAISVQTQTLYFQRWFLGFRVKFLLVLTDILKILENIRLSGGIDLSDVSYFLRKLKGLNGISSKLTRLVEECNLMASSFVNIDSKSLKVISFMAFSCSLFGFFIEFTNLTVDSLVSKNPSESFGDSWHGFVGDLAKRLWHADSKTHMKLMSLLKEYGVDEGSLHLLPFFQFLKISRIPEDILKVCRHSFKEMIQLRNESLNVHNEDTVPQVSKAGIQVLSNIVAAVTHIPFWVPEYFFRVRPSVGSVLISSSASSRKQNTLLVSPGSHLALNLCLQLKNVPSDLCSFSKIYCILNCKTSSGANKGLMPCREVQRGYQASETDMMIDLSKKLQCYVMKQTREFSNHDNLQSSDEMEAYVCFETMHGAQCFSNCVLDVSAFPVGSYTVDWHCGFVDRHGAFWSLLPLSHGPVFSVGESSFHN